METTTNKTIRHSKTSEPKYLTKFIGILDFIAKRLLKALVLASIMILSTSYQSGRGAIDLYESEYAIPQFKLALQQLLSSNAGILSIADIDLQTSRIIRDFYSRNSFAPAWTLTNNFNNHANDLIDLIDHARYYGLEPENYHVKQIKSLYKQLQDPLKRESDRYIRERLELILTDAAFKFMINLHLGYQAYDSTLFHNEWITSLPAQLKDILSGGDTQSGILSVQPVFIEYTRLQQATEYYLKKVSLTDEPVEIADPKTDSSLFWNSAKQALTRLGYISEHTDANSLMEALKAFQKFHGLEADGKPGKNTLEALNQTSLYNYKMLALNLDRLRKQDEKTTGMLYINIPSYQLKVIRENKIQQVYRVIVGNPETPTPLMTANVERIITNPEWNVPRSITTNELLPKIKSDSNYLKKNRFKLIDERNNAVDYQTINWNAMNRDNFDYSIRQDASSDNALGCVKFIFTNPFAVYLHDTPGKRLFSKDIRAFSHGCIRLQNPEKLASYLVNELQPEKVDVETLIRKGIHREIDLQATCPIHIRYLTCEADEDGNPYFYKDIYLLDEQDMVAFLSYAGI